jgi:hypothetical protein
VLEALTAVLDAANAVEPGDAMRGRGFVCLDGRLRTAAAVEVRRQRETTPPCGRNISRDGGQIEAEPLRMLATH